MLYLSIQITRRDDGEYRAATMRELDLRTYDKRKARKEYTFTNEQQARRNLELIAVAAIEDLIADAARGEDTHEPDTH